MAGAASEDNPVGINVVAMVDIIFCLCLFFMCSLKFKELEAKMDSWLPRDKGEQKKQDINVPKEEIRVVLSFDVTTNRLDRMVGRRAIEPGEVGDKKLMSIMKEQYENLRQATGQDVPVIIDAGVKVPWQYVIDVMNTAKELQIPKIEFGFGDPPPIAK